ncbi:hypothetical protein [Streptomyces mirabilis]|uniref:hypothetical protein n=1 Tax=Streptomyces mirabilis TaxID=68239 RepID=UPI00225749CF|nr:hypothetical protein [Streptomyces mirabilis]MCX4430418.1 hypothetical protein [Streptomyces mirabilis]
MAPTPPPKKNVSRRLFLRYSGAAGIAVAAAVSTLHAVGPTAGTSSAARATAVPVRTVLLRRRDDMMNLQILLVNLQVGGKTGAPTLVKQDASQPAFLVVDFGPQSAQERSFPDPGAVGQAPVSLEWGTASRLAFDVTDHLPLPYTTSGLLHWAGFPARLVPNAQGLDVPGTFRGELRAPTSHETSLEVPFGVVVSPDGSSGWCHVETAAVPSSPSGWTELWNTRLGSRVDSSEDGEDSEWTVREDDSARPLRAVWLRDSRFPSWLGNPSSIPTTGPYPTSLTPRNRYDLVRLSSDFSVRTTSLPAPIEADLLSLSALGAGLEAHGSWDTTGSSFSSGLSEWSHSMGLGRDQKVRVAQHGYLLPFGHRAAYVQVTERQMEPDGAGTVSGILRTRTFLVVLERERRYEGDQNMPSGGRAMPFRRIQAVTRTTPTLDQARPYVPMSADPVAGTDTAYAFLAESGSAPLPLHFTGVDWQGRRVSFTAPVVFISERGSRNSSLRSTVATKYNTQTPADHAARLGWVGGKSVALAAPSKPGDTSLPVRALSFGMAMADPATKGVPAFPSVSQVVAELPASVRAFAPEAPAAVLKYFDGYITHGFDDAHNAAGVYLAKAQGSARTALEFAAERSGGIATPGLIMDGLSRKFGPVAGDLVQVARERFDVSQMLADLDVNLLGGVRLSDVVKNLAGDVPNPRQAIKVVTREFDRLEGAVRKLERVEARLSWSPELKAGPGSLNMFVPGPRGRLDVEAVSIVRLLPPLNADYTVRGRLSDVAINIWGDSGARHFVTVGIKSLQFTAAKGRPTDIDCELGQVSFHGPLKYLEEIAKLCRLSVPGMPSAARTGALTSRAAAAPAGSSASPLDVRVVGQQVQAELSLALPSLAFGVFSLGTLNLFAGLYLPFDGSPVRLRFAVNSREAPFSLTISFLGGGGFFALEAGADGVESLETALEVGAGTSFNVAGAVSGHVEAKIGIYFGVRTVEAGDSTAQQVELSAYVRFSGRVRVLGLVSASLDCYLALTYYSGPDRLVGEARVTISIDLCFFDTSVSFSVRRELAGGGSATARAGAGAKLSGKRLAAVAGASAQGFSDAYTQQHWNSYCTAFAPVGA